MKKKPVFCFIFSVICSFCFLWAVHCIFGTEYVSKYFISIFLISIIPMWTIIYYFLKRIYNYYYVNCIKKIFVLNGENNPIQDIFGMNVSNSIISIIICIILLACLIYFKNANIIFFSGQVKTDSIVYALAIIPFLFGSFSGAIMIKSLIHARMYLKNEIVDSCKKNYIYLLYKLKTFLNISIIATYVLCMSMYVVVLLGPRTNSKVDQSLILFLIFLIAWPLVTHIFCRIYLTLVRVKILRSQYSKVNKVGKQLKRDRKMLLWLTGGNDNYKLFSLIGSIIISILQIVIVYIK